jgi:hypothetical protein
MESSAKPYISDGLSIDTLKKGAKLYPYFMGDVPFEDRCVHPYFINAAKDQFIDFCTVIDKLDINNLPKISPDQIILELMSTIIEYIENENVMPLFEPQEELGEMSLKYAEDTLIKIASGDIDAAITYMRLDTRKWLFVAANGNDFCFSIILKYLGYIKTLLNHQIAHPDQMFINFSS